MDPSKDKGVFAAMPPCRPDLPSEPHIIIDNFLEEERAQSIRRAVEKHFGNPQKHQAPSHQIWNYWYVPDLYAYLRTDARKILDADQHSTLQHRIQDAVIRRFGMSRLTKLQISVYLPGCFQGWHNDAEGGTMSFVYSLTSNDRKARGGNTLIMRDSNVGLNAGNTARAGTGLYHSIPPSFNQLLIFDNRAVHAVENLQGAMNPLDCRIVVQGRIFYDGPALIGHEPDPALLTHLEPICLSLDQEIAEQGCSGPVLLDLKGTAEHGTDVGLAYHRIFSRIGDQSRVEAVVSRIMQVFSGLALTALTDSRSCGLFWLTGDRGGHR